MTAKEKLFCTYYLNCHSTYHAAKKAGYKESECEKMEKMLLREDIRAYLSDLDLKSDPVSLTKSAIRGLERLAFSQPSGIGEVFEGSGDLFCVSEIKKNEKGTVEIKFFDRIRALSTLYEIGKSIDESQSVPFFEALSNSAPDEDDDGI